MYLLDTHALVWAITVPERLPDKVYNIVSAEHVKASVVSYWELMLKKGRRAALVTNPAEWWERRVTRASVEVLPIRVQHVDQLNLLGEWHKDPFDRMLVAQARAEGLRLITADATLSRYDVETVW